MTRYRAYCDESRQTENRYMVFGGLIIDSTDVSRIEELLRDFRAEHRLTAELKWTKVSRSKLPDYIAFVDLGFSLMAKDDIHFKSVVFDTTQIDYRTHHNNDKELGFHKLYYHFLLNKFACYAESDDERLLVLLDQRGASGISLNVLRDVLNNGIKRKYKLSARIISAVEARDSKSSDLFQLADILIGAVGWHCNDCHTRLECSQSKCTLADHIARTVRLPSLARQTRFGATRFEIWRFRFRAGAKRTP